jgi:hypothetical protein
MGTPHEEHMAACYAYKALLEEVRNELASAAMKAEQNMGACEGAVGHQPSYHEPARLVWENSASLPESINVIVRSIDDIDSNLDAYLSRWAG